MKFILKFIGRSIFIFCFGAILLALDSNPSKAQETPPPPVPAQQQDTTTPPSAPRPPTSPPAPAPVTFEITGSARSGKVQLPGVTVTAANTLTGKKYVAATSSEGKFSLSGLARGRYVVRIEFIGFAAFTQEVVLNPENPTGKVDSELMLASRQQEQSNNAMAALAAAGRGFQSLAMENSLSSLGGTNGDGGSAFGNSGAQNNGDAGGLPLNGAGAEGPMESVSVSGAQGRTQDFGMGNEEELQQRIQEFRDRMQREGGGAFGPPGGGGFAGGPGIVMMGRMPRGFNINQPHGVFYYTDDNAGLDARPYSLTGIPAAKADYNQARFGFNAGGPLNIPKIFHGGNKWFFFGGWNGSRGSNPYDAFSTVPTQLERNGDLSQATYRDGSPVQIFNPQTGQQYQFNGNPNVLDPASISTSAQALLNYVPLPNMPVNSFGQNFHYVTSANSNSDMVMFRLVHNFNATGGPGGGGPFFTTGGGGGGGGGRRRAQNNINFGLNWARSSNSIVNPFPSQAGGNSTQGLNASAGWVYGKGRVTNNLRVNYNHNHVATTNLYSGVTDVAGLAGINGVSTDPFDWGLPGISFTSFGGLSSPIPRRELDQTYTLSDTISWNHAKHNFRFGADYRRILQSFHSARNGEGSFVFTGYATSQYAAAGTGACAGPLPCSVTDTGYDFADFLLGFPQQTSLQFGTNSYNFRANSYDFFVQDDWRFRPSLSFNLGLRYEYNSPYTEANNRVANLVVAPGFTAATPIVPAGAVLPPSSGTFLRSPTASLIQPERNDWAPRVGIAWKPQKKTVVRAGYGINYNLAQYGVMIQNFAFQPPFANTATNTTDSNALISGSALTLANGFPTTSGTVTNNFAVNPNYRLGYVQIWNLDIQRELPGGVVLNTGYNGAKGTRLDIERALLVAGNQPFTYESSEGNSILHAASVRMRKRMAKGIGLSAQYVYSKSIDDASSIGGGGSVVAQDAFDISADRGLSSFDQRHKFTGNWIYDLPIGENRYFSPKGALGHIFGAWQWSGDFTVGSGLDFTPRVLGGALDIGRGVSGSLRANVVPGQSVAVSNPTALEWFNTAAFCAPSATCVNPGGSAFGDAGRNIIEGPGQVTLDMSLNKTITIKESRALDLRFSANNVFNTVHFTSINTAVNSLTFGEVTGTGSMRRVTMTARFRF
ncbi:MAG TPA: TonB-dependent receptor [Candidatus Acidoferrum sp.]|nr:TonB-dependent receptor [Candidatus Acidoferrum sp.]